MIKGERPGDARSRAPRLPHAPPPRVVLDAESRAIIEHLQVDGRRPFAEIGADLGLSEDEVAARVQELTAAGVMQIAAVTDPLLLGTGRQAMVGVIVDGPLKPVAQRLAAMREIQHVVITAGGFDILVEVVGESDAHLLELVSSRIRTVPGVVALHTFLYLELEKQTYSWGVTRPG